MKKYTSKYKYIGYTSKLKGIYMRLNWHFYIADGQYLFAFTYAGIGIIKKKDGEQTYILN
jgi:hypothetical protein